MRPRIDYSDRILLIITYITKNRKHGVFLNIYKWGIYLSIRLFNVLVGTDMCIFLYNFRGDEEKE